MAGGLLGGQHGGAGGKPPGGSSGGGYGGSAPGGHGGPTAGVHGVPTPGAYGGAIAGGYSGAVGGAGGFKPNQVSGCEGFKMAETLIIFSLDLVMDKVKVRAKAMGCKTHSLQIRATTMLQAPCPTQAKAPKFSKAHMPRIRTLRRIHPPDTMPQDKVDNTGPSQQEFLKPRNTVRMMYSNTLWAKLNE